MTISTKLSHDVSNGLFNKIAIRDLAVSAALNDKSQDRTPASRELNDDELLFVAGGRMATKGRTTCSGGTCDDCG